MTPLTADNSSGQAGWVCGFASAQGAVRAERRANSSPSLPWASQFTMVEESRFQQCRISRFQQFAEILRRRFLFFVAISLR
ncbi:MAG: hypothetical protein LBC37_05340, partial [Zoogloeaceae bacterium]|nr:hypothetical protein [Zoogloeaceae bacterium]